MRKLFLAMSSFFAATQLTAQDFTSPIFGAGNFACSDYLDLDEGGQDIVITWMQGYLTSSFYYEYAARNTTFGPATLGDFEQLRGYLDQYCQDNDFHKIIQAGRNIRREMGASNP